MSMFEDYSKKESPLKWSLKIQQPSENCKQKATHSPSYLLDIITYKHEIFLTGLIIVDIYCYQSG